MSINPLKTLDLFSGIGGFSLGLERTGGFQTTAFCEQDRFCKSILAHHWPNIPIYDDVRLLDFKQGEFDVITGGFPCQPWSVAGAGKGIKDDRDLWPSMLEVIAKVYPKWVIGENVAGFADHAMGLDRTLTQLDAEGYDTWAVNIPACAVQAPHIRERLWIIAYDAHAVDGSCYTAARQRQKQQSRERARAQNVPGADGYGLFARAYGGHEQICRKQPHRQDSADDTEGFNSGQRGPDNIPDPDGLMREARGPGIGSKTGSQFDNCWTSDLSDGRRGRGQGSWFGECAKAEPPRWEPEPGLGMLADGVSHRVAKLAALGNAVVPQVVTRIGHAILAAENATSKKSHSKAEKPLERQVNPVTTETHKGRI